MTKKMILLELFRSLNDCWMLDDKRSSANSIDALHIDCCYRGNSYGYEELTIEEQKKRKLTGLEDIHAKLKSLSELCPSDNMWYYSHKSKLYSTFPTTETGSLLT